MMNYETSAERMGIASPAKGGLAMTDCFAIVCIITFDLPVVLNY
jgi:hypothetical protein